MWSLKNSTLNWETFKFSQHILTSWSFNFWILKINDSLKKKLIFWIFKLEIYYCFQRNWCKMLWIYSCDFHQRKKKWLCKLYISVLNFRWFKEIDIKRCEFTAVTFIKDKLCGYANYIFLYIELKMIQRNWY